MCMVRQKPQQLKLNFKIFSFSFLDGKKKGPVGCCKRNIIMASKFFFGPYLDYPLTWLWDDFWQLRKSWPPTYLHYIALTCLQHCTIWFRSTSTLLIIIQHGSMFGMFVAKSIQVSKKIYLPFLEISLDKRQIDSTFFFCNTLFLFHFLWII